MCFGSRSSAAMSAVSACRDAKLIGYKIQPHLSCKQVAIGKNIGI